MVPRSGPCLCSVWDPLKNSQIFHFKAFKLAKRFLELASSSCGVQFHSTGTGTGALQIRRHGGVPRASYPAAERAGEALRVKLAPAQGCRETKMRDSVMAGPEECLTLIIFDDIITAQSDPSPGSYRPSPPPPPAPAAAAAQPHCLSDMSETDFREPSLSFA